MSEVTARLFRLVIVGVALFTAGCAANMRNAVPNGELAQRARVADLPGVRFWGDEVPDRQTLLTEIRRRLPNAPRRAAARRLPDGRALVDVLALSGGGGDGAYGAGLLTGWSARGDRPAFAVVTGVSAGAIIAPFAFLGPHYDRKLEEIWTEYGTNQILTAQILPGLLGGPALADTTPLQNLIARYVDKRMLREIAEEYRKGRVLLVGTTNLDAQRPVVWNMSEIAASNHPDALDLFRKVILASAAIPGAFPPVGITVEVDGKDYEEMHVDGGATREVFVSAVQVPFRYFDDLYCDAPPCRKPLRRFYIVKNGKLEPEYDAVAKQTIPIAARAISTLIKSQHAGDLYRIFRMVQDDRAEFYLAAVPRDFKMVAKEAFDRAYQTELFKVGVGAGREQRWQRVPPDTLPTRRVAVN